MKIATNDEVEAISRFALKLRAYITEQPESDATCLNACLMLFVAGAINARVPDDEVEDVVKRMLRFVRCCQPS